MDRHNFNQTDNCIYCKKSHFDVVDERGFVREDCIGKQGLQEIEKEALLISKVISLLRNE